MEFETFHSIIADDDTADPKQDACDALQKATERLQDLAKSRPDDGDNLQEEQDMWVVSWGKELTAFNLVYKVAKEHDVAAMTKAFKQEVSDADKDRIRWAKRDPLFTPSPDMQPSAASSSAQPTNEVVPPHVAPIPQLCIGPDVIDLTESPPSPTRTTNTQRSAAPPPTVTKIEELPPQLSQLAITWQNTDPPAPMEEDFPPTVPAPMDEDVPPTEVPAPMDEDVAPTAILSPQLAAHRDSSPPVKSRALALRHLQVPTTSGDTKGDDGSVASATKSTALALPHLQVPATSGDTKGDDGSVASATTAPSVASSGRNKRQRVEVYIQNTSKNLKAREITVEENEEEEEDDASEDRDKVSPLGPDFDPNHGPIISDEGFLRPGVGKYLIPCERCSGQASICFGHPGMTCDPCFNAKKKCTKSSGRGRPAGPAGVAKDTEESKPKKPLPRKSATKAAAAKAAAPKPTAKPAAKVTKRAKAASSKATSTSLVGDDSDDDIEIFNPGQDSPPRKRSKKGKERATTSDSDEDDIVALEQGLLSIQAETKRMEAQILEMKARRRRRTGK